MYHEALDIFEKFDLLGIQYPVEDKHYPFLATFDFEVFRFTD